MYRPASFRSRPSGTRPPPLTTWLQTASPATCPVARPATCAGFLLKGAEHNLGVRLAIIASRYDPRTVRSDVPLYKSYREMAEANGVPPDDPALEACRGVDERWPRR